MEDAKGMGTFISSWILANSGFFEGSAGFSGSLAAASMVRRSASSFKRLASAIAAF